MDTARSFPRVVIGAAGSGAGKTTVVCAILRALQNRGLRPASFKCGPDYIDPMFHTEVLGVPSRNLDLFFFSRETARALFAKNAAGRDISVIEGVMGFYDGIGSTDRASTSDLANQLDAPAVLVMDCAGMGLSAAAAARGFLSFRKNQIRGLILNRLKPMGYSYYKELLERETGIPVLGYLPPMPECSLESRHLGLVTAGEVRDLREKLDRIACQAEKSIDLDALIRLARTAPEMEPAPPAQQSLFAEPVRIGIARDAAFQFYYEDALDLLRSLGADLIPFSPLADPSLPENLQGLLLGGGYPELHTQELSGNKRMLEEISREIRAGMPCIAECGGFQYLQESLEGTDGKEYPMAGVLPGHARRTPRLVRFGYVNLRARQDNLLCGRGEGFPAHEFHYWDSTENGNTFTAGKPSGKSWDCCFSSGTLYAGYPHFHFCACPQAARRFLRKAHEYGRR